MNIPTPPNRNVTQNTFRAKSPLFSVGNKMAPNRTKTSPKRPTTYPSTVLIEVLMLILYAELRYNLWVYSVYI